MFKWICNIITYPINWFWKQYQSYKDSNDTLGIIALFFVSLTGSLLIGGIIVYAGLFILENHFYLVVICGLIYWLYNYVRDRQGQQLGGQSKVQPGDVPADEQLEREYVLMRRIVFQLLRATAEDIGCKIPRLIGEVEMPESRYIISNNICFYQFRLLKQDFNTNYKIDDLAEYKLILQSTINHKLKSGEFPAVKLEDYRDQFGKLYSSVIIDTVEDAGTELIIQTVFITPQYAQYHHQIELEKQASNKKTPVEKW